MGTTLYLEIARNLAAGWGAGLLIGLERSTHGRAAGFRTHALVGLASAAAIVLALQPLAISASVAGGLGRLDPSRLGQGVMTGIGFLGAGVIFKEGVSVQGLTTAASVWATAAVGMLFGAGMIFPGVFTTVLVLATLVILRWVEDRIPWNIYALAIFRFEAAQVPTEQQLGELLDRHDVTLSEVSYKLVQGGQIFEYWTDLKTTRRDGFESLAKRLPTIPGLVEYEISRISK